MSRSFFTNETLNEFKNNNNLFGGQKVTITKATLAYIKKMISLDRMAARVLDRRVYTIHVTYSERAFVSHKKVDTVIAGRSSVRKTSNNTEVDAMAYISADEWATSKFDQKVVPLLKLHSFVASLPGSLFPKNTRSDRTARSIMETAIRNCMSYPEAYFDVDDDETLDRFENTSKIADRLNEQMMGKSVEIPFWTEEDIECFAGISTGKTKYTPNRVMIACASVEGYVPYDAAEIFANLEDREYTFYLHKGESWAAYRYVEKLVSMVDSSWEDVENEIRFSTHFRKRGIIGDDYMVRI